jgi:hypothetical protein
MHRQAVGFVAWKYASFLHDMLLDEFICVFWYAQMEEVKQ